MYIIIIDRSLLPSHNPVVIPVERPTVPNALVISNNASIKEMLGSMITIRYVPVITTLNAMRVITAAFRKASAGTAYLKPFSDLLVRC